MNSETKERVTLCLKRIRRKDDSAYEDLHLLIGGRIRLIAMKYIKNSSDVDDLIQDFWLDMDKFAMKSLLVQDSFCYLMKIFENLAKQKYNKDKKNKQNLNYDDLEYFCSDEVNIEQNVIDRELYLSFRKYLKALSREEKLLFEMTFIKGMTIRQIAKYTNASKSKVFRDLGKLTDKLKGSLRDENYDID